MPTDSAQTDSFSAATAMAAPSALLRERWLAALLPLAGGAGWTEAAAERAADAVGLEPGERALAAPGGVSDLIDHWVEGAAEAAAAAHLADPEAQAAGTTARLTALVVAWLDGLAPHPQAARRALSRAVLPWNAPRAAKGAWAVADVLWTAAGDVATDHNRLTKRGLLVAALGPVVSDWANGARGPELQERVRWHLVRAGKTGARAAQLARPAAGLLATGLAARLLRRF